MNHGRTTYGEENAWQDAGIRERGQKSETAQQRQDWWHASRFGLFIHWNMSSLMAAEISWARQFYADDGEDMVTPNPRPDRGRPEYKPWDVDWFKPAVPGAVYDNLFKSFHPAMFDADRIVAQAKDAGMKYIVMVAKHHDGFCMWETAFTDYSIMRTPFKRDILGEMAAATRRAGLRFGVYYSQRDWRHPDYTNPDRALYNRYMRDQIGELLTRYSPVSILWFDAEGWDPEVWDAESLFKMVYKIQPELLINNRCGVPGDFETPEQQIGAYEADVSWESCMTFTGFWSWHGFAIPVIPAEECLQRLITCAGGDGNLLMNIGPMPTGEIDPREASRLAAVGAWMRLNGDAIYGTRGGPYKPGPWGASTRRDRTINLLIADWNRLPDKLPPLAVRITEATGLGGAPVAFLQDDTGVTLILPENQRTPPVTRIHLALEGSAMDLPAVSTNA